MHCISRARTFAARLVSGVNGLAELFGRGLRGRAFGEARESSSRSRGGSFSMQPASRFAACIELKRITLGRGGFREPFDEQLTEPRTGAVRFLVEVEDFVIRDPPRPEQERVEARSGVEFVPHGQAGFLQHVVGVGRGAAVA